MTLASESVTRCRFSLAPSEGERAKKGSGKVTA
jgi:hypothetical protein